MTDAEKAYAAAVKEIGRWPSALDFNQSRFGALDRLPPEIDMLKYLTSLNLIYTQVSDITPLAKLTALETLRLDNTQVSDLTPLAKLTALRILTLRNTEVSDLTPLAKLTALQNLWLLNTQVSDLRPIRDLQQLGERTHGGLFFTNTPFAEANDVTRRLAAITNDKQRTRETMAYLKTLPPWPQPLPWEKERLGTATPEPALPAPMPAPLQVIERDGVLRPAMPGDALDEAAHLRAQQGWEALRDYLADMADQMPRIGNALPRLAKAMARLDAALGTDYAAINPIAVGTQGNRVIVLAAGAAEVLSDDDAADVAEFAAALALFLDRFPAWRAYRQDAVERPIDPDSVQDALRQIEEIASDLEDREGIDPALPAALEEQADAVREIPEDAIAAKGLIVSLGNALGAIANRAMTAVRVIRREVGDIAGKTWELAKVGIATTLAGHLLAALDILVTNGAMLRGLATRFPEALGWLTNVQNYLEAVLKFLS
jgi:hypothetical protein